VPGTDAEVEGESVKVVGVRSDWKIENAQGVGENLATITRQGGASTGHGIGTTMIMCCTRQFTQQPAKAGDRESVDIINSRVL